MTVSNAYKSLIDIMEAKGFGTSVANQVAVDRAGNPIPWFSYPAIDYLNGIDLRDKRVFEFGSGCSTLFWAQNCREVVGVESDRQWFAKVQSVLPPNCLILLRDDESAYVNALEEYPGDFDVIIIDGAMNRRKMAEKSLAKLHPGGFIILDNSDCHVKAASVLRDADLIQVDLVGFAPINHFEQATSFFFRRDCRLKPRSQWQPAKSAGSMVHYVDE